MMVKTMLRISSCFRINDNVIQLKFLFLFVAICLSVFAMIGCHSPGHNKNTMSVCVIMNQDTSRTANPLLTWNGKDTIRVDKIVISKSEQKNQPYTHIGEFWKHPKIDFKEIVYMVRNNFWHFFEIALLWISILAILIFVIRELWHCCCTVVSERHRQSYRYRNFGLQVAAYVTFISGCVLYYVGFFKTGTASSFIAYFVRPFIASLGMFVGNTSYQEVCEECTDNPIYMTFFGLIHLSAIVISATVVINFFWRRLSSSFVRHLWLFQAIVLKQKKAVNIFWGVNEPNFILAKEMIGKGEHVVFIDGFSNESNKTQQMSLSQIFGLFPYDGELIRRIKGWHCVLMNATYDLDKDEDDNEFILDKLGIGRLRVIIKNSKEARLFFLSDIAQTNVKSVINIQEDVLFKNPPIAIDLYCHAPRNSHNLALERKRRKDEKEPLLAVHIIDSSYLSIQWLKTNPKHHPVQFVTQTLDEQKRGVVNSEFNALIVGFGETGKEALSFLYEFGAFVNDNQVRSPFCCHIADPNSSISQSEFYMKRPALKGNKSIVFLNLSDKDDGYWEKIEEIMPKLQYVVVSTGTDENNMKVAVDLYQLAIRCRNNDLTNFKIYVRSYFLKNELWMNSIANYYNSNNHNSQGEIVVFGKMSDIYTYENVVEDKVLEEANQYGAKYYEAFEKLEAIVGREDVQLSGLAKIRKQHRSLSQDIANSQHAKTKFLLMGLNEEKLKRLFTEDNLTVEDQEMKSRLIEIENFSESKTFLFEKDYSKLTDETQLLMYNMALCEHLRWNAAHEMMGYVYGEKKNEVVKQHDCLTDFSKLPKFTKKPFDKRDYDFLVLETSIKLKIKEIMDDSKKVKKND